jgi:nitrite reductase/ring-hydroxylating ferredoxin subunit
MERQEFLKTLGISFAVACAGSCLSACGKDGETKPKDNPPPPPPTGTSVSANLSELTNIGARVIVSGIAFFRIAAGNTASSFIATQPQCTHQNGDLNWIQSSNLIVCNLHSAKFDSNGVNTSPPTTGGTASNLKTYVVTLNATTVSVSV